MEKTEKELQELKSKSTCNCKCIVEQTLAKTVINHAADTSALAESFASVEPSGTEPYCAQETSAQSLAPIEYPSNVPYLAQSATTNQILVTKKRADPPPFLTSTKGQSANSRPAASQEYSHKQGHLSILRTVKFQRQQTVALYGFQPELNQQNLKKRQEGQRSTSVVLQTVYQHLA